MKILFDLIHLTHSLLLHFPPFLSPPSHPSISPSFSFPIPFSLPLFPVVCGDLGTHPTAQWYLKGWGWGGELGSARVCVCLAPPALCHLTAGWHAGALRTQSSVGRGQRGHRGHLGGGQEGGVDGQRWALENGQAQHGASPSQLPDLTR